VGGKKTIEEVVSEADVVIIGPNLAVALKYDSATMRAPEVIARGEHDKAEEIGNVARSHIIPIVDDETLARILFNAVKIGQKIRTSHYRLVAEVLP